MRATVITQALCCIPLLLLLGSCGDDSGSDPEPTDSGVREAPPVQDAAADESPPECSEDADCDDNLDCNGTETCVQGRCRSGEPVHCDDGIECTDDVCAELTRSCRSMPPDRDADGHFDITCVDENGTPFGMDCDDEDALRFPGNLEMCDEAHHDEDCDPNTAGDKDSDGDGFFDRGCCNPESDEEDASLICGRDCDDNKPNVNPEATEACDGFDNDCDDDTDEGVRQRLYIDADFDGHGDMAALAEAEDEEGVTWGDFCNKAGFVAVELTDDCADDDPEVYPGLLEFRREGQRLRHSHRREPTAGRLVRGQGRRHLR